MHAPDRIVDSTATPPGLHLPGMRFAALARAQPHAPALVWGAERLTYAELLGRAERIAGGLAARRVGPGAVVGLYLERGADMVAAVLGVSLAGAAYLPLDPRYPVARTLETLADAAPALVLAGASDALLPGITLLPVEQCAAPFSPARGSLPDDPAYIIYTSGSTGRPKGVVVPHSNLLRLVDRTADWFNFGPADIWTLFHSLAFDFSVWELWGALLTGGCLVVVPHAVTRDPQSFRQLLAAERVTVLNQTPSAFALLDRADAGAGDSLALRTVIFGGEALQPGLLAGWIARHGDGRPRLFNMYGITETTVHVTCRRMLAADAAHERESVLGEPIDDLMLHVLDEALNPAEEGELCIAGAGVATGYLNRPELTAQRFVRLPSGERVYRSGDRVRRRADGELVYGGRLDGQIKLNGFRIEPGEVEAALGMVPGVHQACVALVHTADAVPQLAAWWTGPAPRHALADALRQTLPAHMVPSLFTPLAAFPLNRNGKIDRAALPLAIPASAPIVDPAPASLETRVAAAWSAALGHTSFSPDDNFFEVGGTSVLLVAVRARLAAEFHRDLPVTLLFEAPTVRSLARRLAQADLPTPITGAPRAQHQRAAFARARATRPAALPEVRP